MTVAHVDPSAAARTHYATDPRIRHLAEAAWRMRTGGTRQDWLQLGKDNPEALIREAREWVRAAVAGGLMEAPSDDPEWKAAAHRAAEVGPQDDAPCAATFREPPTPNLVYCQESGDHQRHTSGEGDAYYTWQDGDEGAGWDR